MENASKALIIAGAILLAILIISLGIMIYQQAAGVVNTDAMSEVETTSFNSRISQYEGTNVRGAQVNALLNQIQQNNVTYQDDTSKQISVTVSASKWQTGTKPTGAIDGSTAYAKANTGATYDVSYTTNTKTGLIDKVTIADSGSGS